jgi:predicted small secreted protein
MIKNSEFTKVQLECIYIYLAKELRGLTMVSACVDLGVNKKLAADRYHRGHNLIIKATRLSTILKKVEKELGEIEGRWYQKYMDQLRDHKKTEMVYDKEISRLQTLLELKQVESSVIYDQSVMNAEEYDRLSKEDLIAEILKCKSAIASMNNLFNKSYQG